MVGSQDQVTEELGQANWKRGQGKGCVGGFDTVTISLFFGCLLMDDGIRFIIIVQQMFCNALGMLCLSQYRQQYILSSITPCKYHVEKSVLPETLHVLISITYYNCSVILRRISAYRSKGCAASAVYR